MSFVRFSPLVIGGGVLALAVILYLLQQLRARPRVVRLPAAMLWNRVVHEVPVRVLRKAFRYWLAYLLTLLIAVSLWLAASGPERDAVATRDMQTFYLDASAQMTAGGAFAAATRALLADVRATPADRRQVRLGDAFGATLLEPGENIALLARRLQGREPGAYPSSFAAWYAGFTRGGGTVRYYGAWSDAKGVAVAPDARIVPGYLAPPVTGNRGIVALGMTPAASGAWDRADVLVATAAARGDPPGIADLVTSIDGAAIAPARVDAAGRARFVLRDVPAAGGTLRVALRRGDALPADDAAELTLPDRRPVRVAIGAGVPEGIRRVVRLDPAFALAPPNEAQVVVRRADDGTASTLPALVLTAPQAGGATFVYSGPDDAAAGGVTAQVDRLGLAQIDAGALADRLQRPVAVDVVGAGRRSVAVWSSVFDESAGFVRSSAMPVFVSQSLRWLADPQPWIADARAGGAPVDQSALYGLAERGAVAAQRLNGDLFLPQAGRWRIGDRDIAVSLTDPRVTMADGGNPPGIARPAGGGFGPDLPFLLAVALAGLLLVIEWLAVRRGMMP